MSGHFTKYYVVRTTIRGQEALVNEDAGAYEPVYLSNPVDAYIEALSAHAGEPQAGEKLKSRINELEKLTLLHEQYAEFVNNGNEGAIRLAFAHGWRIDQAVFDEGLERRAEITARSARLFPHGSGAASAEEGIAAAKPDAAIPQKRQHAGEGKAPTVVCLCGSTRFMEAYQAANLSETLAGRIVLSIGCNTKSDTDLVILGTLTIAGKRALDELHKRKIDLADEILVLNVGGYIGQSTRSEIDYAIEHGKRVRWLEPERAPLVGRERPS